MAINTNRTPYFDDFNPSKNFHRILFKPGVSVQARELTQSQTILQNQISEFASAIYSQNTPISGGKVTTNLNANYIKLNPTYNNSSVDVTQYVDSIITDSTGTIIAKVVAASPATGTTTVPGDPPTLVVNYQSGSTFSDGMTLYEVGETTSSPFASTIGIVGETTSVGNSSTASISEGVFFVVSGSNEIQNVDGSTENYQIGNFVSVAAQTIIIDKYDNSPTLRVGLNISENIVTYQDDETLLDPALGSTNYQSPGADRYQILLTLESRPITLGNDDNFIELVSISEGQIIKMVDNTVYSTINDYIAKRDYETNGDYIVYDFKLTAAANNALNINSNDNQQVGNSALWDLGIGKGVAYVRGYRIENQSEQKISIPRARTTNTIDTNSIVIDYGNYFVVDTLKGTFDVTSQQSIDLHCVTAQNVSVSGANSYNSTLVGTAKIRDLRYVSSTGANLSSYIFNAYVCDTNYNTLSSNVTSSTATTITVNDTTNKFSPTANAYLGVTLKIVSGADFGDIRTVSSYTVAGNNKTFTVNSPFTVNPASSDGFSLLYNSGNVNSLTRQNGSYTALSANANISLAGGGKSGITYNTPTVLRNSNSPELLFPLGYRYVANVSDSNYYSTMLFRNQKWNNTNKTLTLNLSLPGIIFNAPISTTLSGSEFKQLFTLIDQSTGDILDFTYSGNSAFLTSNSTVTFTSNTYGVSANNIDVYTSVFVKNGDASAPVIKYKTLIQGNSTFGTANASLTPVTSNVSVDLATGQAYILNQGVTTGKISLYVNDVKKIIKIIDTGSTSANAFGQSLANFSEITGSFSLDSGQRDDFYDHASISLMPGVSKPRGNILVIFDHYSHSGGDGYFSVNSYINESYAQIPFYTAKNGVVYSLRDCMDFRPCRQNLVTTGAWEYNNSPLSSPYNGGTLIPRDFTNVQNNYSYYLGRKDLLVLTKDSQFKTIQGSPSLSPIFPQQPNGTMLLANITLDPYTAYAPGENPNGVPTNISIETVEHKRWAKSEITDLQNQVDRLEYYTALSLLESAATSSQIPNNFGVTRPNYGILVDDFSSFATADTYNANYTANINIRTRQLTALHNITNFQLQNQNVLNSLGTLTNFNSYRVSSINGTQTNIYSLPYDTVKLISQPLASNTISVNPFSVVLQQGFLSLNPPMDNWVNDIQTPVVLITDPTLQFNQKVGGVSLINGGDFASLTGTKTSAPVTSTDFSDVSINIITNPTNSFVTRPTSQYIAQTTGLTKAEVSSAASPALATNNGYVTNTAVSAHIRPQEVIVRAKNMLVNANVHCYFDGTNVDQWMMSPDTIELTNVTGTFNQDDIVGFYEPSVSQFFPVARVVSAYKYPNTTKVRLYIASMIGLPATVTSSATFQNAFFDTNGNYQGRTATGNIVLPASSNSIINLHTTGIISHVGGGFTPTGGSVAIKIYKSAVVSGWSDFLNNYGAWGDNNRGSTWVAQTTSVSSLSPFAFTPETTGSYTVRISGGTISSATVYLTSGTSTSAYSTFVSGSALSTNPNSYTVSLTAGTTYRANWSLTHSGGLVWTGPAFAMTITDNSTGIIVWNSLTPPNLSVVDGSVYTCPGGGSLYAGVKRLQLDLNASKTDNIYVGAEISIRSTYTYTYTYGAIYYPPPPTYVNSDGDAPRAHWIAAQIAKYNAEINQNVISLQNKSITLSATSTFTATITSYDGDTQTAILDKPVNVSMGYNDRYLSINSQYTIRGTATSVAAALYQGSAIPGLSTNENGDFIAIFNIPGSVFKTGQRVFRIDNRSILSDPTTSTTWAEGTFYASGLQNLQQGLDFAASVDSSSISFNQTAQNGYAIVAQSSKIDPIAQTFMIDKTKYPDGVFLSSLKLYFAPFTNNRSPNVPVTVYLLNTLNGYPSGQSLAYSTVTVSPSNIKTSTNPRLTDTATTTEFTFNAPIYIQPGVLYAFVVQSCSADYNLWYAKQNQVAINYSTGTTTTKIGQSPGNGSLFESQNSITWTSDQSRSLMYEFSHCIFDTTKTPEIPFVIPKGLPYRKLGRYDVMHGVSANSVPNVFTLFSDNQFMDAFNVSTTDFIPSSTKIDYACKTTLADGFQQSPMQQIFPGKYGTPSQDNVYLNDGLGERVLLQSSNNSFQLFATLSSTNKHVSPIICDDGVSVYSIIYNINDMGIDGNIISIVNGGTGYNVNTVSISASAPDVGTDYPVFECVANTTTGAIESVYTTYPGSGYLTNPTITILDPSTRSGNANASVIVQGESSPVGGNAYAKYFTKKVVMPPGSDAGDMRVYYSAYKPIGSDVHIYYKILSSQDNQVFEDQDWQLMTQTTNTGVFSSNRSNIIEYECSPGVNNIANNNISYTSTNGVVYNNFIQFAIKVALRTNDRTSVPFLTDIRAIALPSGTGL